MSVRTGSRFVERLRCPRCRSAIAGDGGAGYRCAGCGDVWVRPTEAIWHRAKLPMRPDEVRESEFHDRENADPATRALELERPYGGPRSYEYLQLYDLHVGLRLLLRAGFDPARDSVLGICCGRGMDLDFFMRAGLRVAGLDVSVTSLGIAEERLRRTAAVHGGRLEGLVQGSAYRLPFADHAWDVVYCHDGLHHLDDPLPGVVEMLRVARRAVLVLEPNDSALVRLLQMTGLVATVEPVGNVVRRFRAHELARLGASRGFPRLEVRYSFRKFGHRPATWYRHLDTPVGFVALKGFVRAMSALWGRQSNYMVCLLSRAD